MLGAFRNTRANVQKNNYGLVFLRISILLSRSISMRGLGLLSLANEIVKFFTKALICDKTGV